MTNKQKLIYLDNAATTKVAPEVFEVMLPFLKDEYANPATMYSCGQTAAAAVEEARGKVAELLHADKDEIYFTSGGTEGDNWAIISSLGKSDKKHLLVSSIEHHAVLETAQKLVKTRQGVELTLLPVDEFGLVKAEVLKNALREDTALVSIMQANNEIGTIQDIKKLAEIAHQAGAFFHTDAVQSVGKLKVNVEELGVDLLSISGHKFHAAKGIGALYIRKGVKLPALINGGGQERKRRSGTLNVPAIVGMGKAAELVSLTREQEEGKLRKFTNRLWLGLQDAIPKISRNGHPEQCLPGMLNITVTGIEGEAMLLMLDLQAGVCVSSGSACTTGSLDPSHVLLAIGIPAEVAHGSLRFSMSRYTTAEDIDAVLHSLPKIVENLRLMSPTWNG